MKNKHIHVHNMFFWFLLIGVFGLTLWHIFELFEHLKELLIASDLSEEKPAVFDTEIFANDLLPTLKYFITSFASTIFVLLWAESTAKKRELSAFSSSESVMPDAHLYFALTWLTWSIPTDFLGEAQAQKDILKYFLSATNNIFIFSTLRYFQHGGVLDIEPWLKKVRINRNNYLQIIWIVCVVIVVIEGYLFRGNATQEGKIIDAIVSTLSLSWLGIAISITFMRRFSRKVSFSLIILTCLPFLVGIIFQWISALSAPNDFFAIKKLFSLVYPIGITFISSALSFSWVFMLSLKIKDKLDNKIKEQQSNKSVYEKEIKKEKERTLILTKQAEQDMIHIIRNCLFYVEEYFTKKSVAELVQITSLKTIFEKIYLAQISVDEKENLIHARIPLKDYLSDIINALKSVLKWEELNIDLEAIPIELKVVETSAFKLGRIILETAMNAYKYSENDKRAWITAKWEKHYIYVSVEDRGSGFSPNALEENNNSTKIGLKMIKLNLEDFSLLARKATMEIKGLKKGTQIIYQIPNYKFSRHEGTSRR